MLEAAISYARAHKERRPGGCVKEMNRLLKMASECEALGPVGPELTEEDLAAMIRRPAGVIAAEIVSQVFWTPGKQPTEKERKLCLLITEAIAQERRHAKRRPCGHGPLCTRLACLNDE